ncbi:MAG: eukaryotic-like serine/threonine-protein kinase, partial [Candidatus Binatota bacterium]|nr:eukaryotic-like serine/threonine-protein kinase [Candidatus Binatota bacterium]
MSPESLGRIGRYELVRVLGRGAMGTVYEAYDSFLGRTVAVKTYESNVLLGDELRRRFEREVKAASRLHHPNIVVVYDGGLEKDVPFIAMEYVEGTNLDAELKNRGKMPPHEALPVLLLIADALAYAHRQGVIHRDLKPANILLTTAGQPKIADFSVAKLMSAEATVGPSPLGTPTHMAPEQIAGKPTDPRVDVFALGVLSYQVLTGRRPFEGDHPTAVIYNIMNVDPPRASEIDPSLPPGVDAVLARAFAKDPQQRTPDATTFARDLKSALESVRAAAQAAMPEAFEGDVAASEGDFRSGDLEAFRDLAPPPSRRTRSLVFAGQVALVAAIALLGLVFLIRRMTDEPVGGLPAATPVPDEFAGKEGVPNVA